MEELLTSTTLTLSAIFDPSSPTTSEPQSTTAVAFATATAVALALVVLQRGFRSWKQRGGKHPTLTPDELKEFEVGGALRARNDAAIEDAVLHDVTTVAVAQAAASTSSSNPTPPHLTVRRISGGMTNHMFFVECSQQQQQQRQGQRDRTRETRLRFAIRVYGPASSSLVERDRELALLKALGEAGLSPKVLLEFKNGRVEQWIDDARTLVPRELGAEEPMDFAALIAKEVSRLHAFEVPKDLSSSPSELWTRLERWMRAASQAAFSIAPNSNEDLDLDTEKRTKADSV